MSTVRLMADTVDHSAPAGYDLYAGYIDGAYRSYPYLAAQYPGRTVSITVLGDPSAQVCDVETGDVSIVHAPAWVKSKGADRYMLWIADYGVPKCPLAGAVAWQKIDSGPHGENIDVSEVYDGRWPYSDLPTIYCPYSWAGALMQTCSSAGLTFVGADTSPVPTPPQEEDVLPLCILSTPGYQVLWNLAVNKIIPIPGPADSQAFKGVPVFVVDDAQVQAIQKA